MTIKPSIKSLSKRLSRAMWPKETNRSPSLSELSDMIPELSEISEILEDRLYLSGCLPVTKKGLAELGITAVVSAMTEEEEKREGRPKNIGKVRRICVRMTDTNDSDLSAFFRPATSFIDTELRKGGKVLVHCVAGVSRSVSLVMAYLVRYGGLSSKDAYVLVKNKRTIARPNDSFCHQIMDFERSLGQKRSTSSLASQCPAEETEQGLVAPLALI